MMPTFVLHKNNFTQPIEDYKQIIDSRKIDFNCNSIPNIRVNVNNKLDPTEVTRRKIDVKRTEIVAIVDIRGTEHDALKFEFKSKTRAPVDSNHGSTITK